MYTKIVCGLIFQISLEFVGGYLVDKETNRTKNLTRLVELITAY